MSQLNGINDLKKAIIGEIRVVVKYNPFRSRFLGMAFKRSDDFEIKLYEHSDNRTLVETLIHELVHVKQSLEGCEVFNRSFNQRLEDEADQFSINVVSSLGPDVIESIANDIKSNLQ